MAQAAPEQQAEFAKARELPAPWGHELLTEGVSAAFTAGVAMVALALLTALPVIRVRNRDLAALNGTGADAGPTA